MQWRAQKCHEGSVVLDHAQPPKRGAFRNTGTRSLHSEAGLRGEKKGTNIFEKEAACPVQIEFNTETEATVPDLQLVTILHLNFQLKIERDSVM